METFSCPPATIKNNREPENRAASEEPAIVLLKKEQPEKYRKIVEVQKRLREPIAEGGSVFLANADLAAAYAVYEVLGEHWEELVRATDLRAYTDAMPYDPEKTNVIGIEYPPFFHDTGHLDEASVRVSFFYKDHEGYGAVVQRGFFYGKPLYAKDPTAKRIAHHDVFSLPEKLQDRGIAARLLSASLEQYDAAGIEEIHMRADIDVGGYVWATYGFGWDEERMSERAKEQLRADACEHVAIVLAQLNVSDQQEPYSSWFHQITQARTPQEIAIVGADGPFFTRDDEGGWSIHASRADAADRGAIYHAGKIALIKNEWWAKLELRNDGPQQGRNRKMVEDALARRIKKL